MNVTTDIYIDNYLWYKTNGEYVFWDITSFRPNIRKELIKKKIYHGVIKFEKENLPKGEEILVPTRIKIKEPGKKSIFINVR